MSSKPEPSIETVAAPTPDEEIRDALVEAGAAPPPAPRGHADDWIFLGACGLSFVAAVAAHQFVDHPGLAWLGGWRAAIARGATAVASIVVVLALVRVVEGWILARVRGAAARHDLRRVLRLLAAITIAIAGLTALFADWTTAAVSLGLLSLVLGFALQTPITSLIGWIYLLVRRPYRVGDRIKVAGITGDVIDVGYLDTTLWEFGGDYLSTDHPSGRLVKFPNGKVLEEAVYNYSWPLFPYIWNEVKVTLAYETDLALVSKIMLEVVDAEVGVEMRQHVRAYRELLARTAVDELQVREEPAVFFRTNELGWVDGIVRYVVHPRHAGRVKNRIVEKLLKRLNEHSDRVLFPKGPNR